MQQEFEQRVALRCDPRADRFQVDVEIRGDGIFRDLQPSAEDRYLQTCKERLDRFAAQQSLEVVWSGHFDHQYTTIRHHLDVRGVLRLNLLSRLTRVLRPSMGYRALEFLQRGVAKGWRIEPFLRAAVESQRLQRFDLKGKRLEDPLPTQLLLRTLVETNWQPLFGPADNPWAYINTVTQRIYQRQYQDPQDGKGARKTYKDDQEADRADQRRSYALVEAGHELAVEDVPGVLRANGFTEDMIAVALARFDGRAWREIGPYLTIQSGTLWPSRRVEAARGGLRRAKTLRNRRLANSVWRPRSTSAMVYRERVPDGRPWGGLWNYAHRYQGGELDVLRDIQTQERLELFKQ
jgi:hypothetical protein